MTDTMTLLDRIAEVSARLNGMRGFPILESVRLRLRAPKETDVAALFRQFSHPEVMRYWSRPAMKNEAEAVAYIENIAEGFMRRETLNWIIADLGNDAMLGTCTLYDLQPSHLRAAVGYAVHPDHQGRGIASEAVAMACAWAFDLLGLHRIEADIHPANAPSRRVLERCGFAREGLLRERFVSGEEIQDSEIYGLLAEQR